MNESRYGVTAGGNFIVDRVVMVDRYPLENTLASIYSETRSSGGCPFTVLKDLAILGAAFPLSAIGTLGDDADGAWVRADCATFGIDTARLMPIDGATTSYTYAMTVRSTGRRTFFHRRGANALLAPHHFHFAADTSRIFVLGYLLLLDTLDTWVAPGVTGAARVLAQARREGLTTVVDLVSTPHAEYRAIVWSALAHVDHLLLNEWEAALALGRSFADCGPAELLAAARDLAAAGVRETVVVHSEAGVVAVNCRTGEACVQGSVALPRELVAGATGAGDAFTAGYVLALHAGDPIARRLRAGVCAAAACLRDPSASGGIESLERCLALSDAHGFAPFAAPAQATSTTDG